MNNTSLSNATTVAPEVVEEVDAVAVIILCVLAIATISTNGLVLLTIIRDPLKCLRSPAASFIAGLTVANLLTGLIVEPAFIYWFLRNAIDEHADVVAGVAALLSLNAISASLLIILALAVTQYIGVSSPALFRKIVSPRSARIGVGCIFLYTFLFSLLPVFGVSSWSFFEVHMFLHITLITVAVVLLYMLMYCKFRQQWGPARSPEERGSDENEQERQAMNRDFTKGTFILTAFMIVTVWPYAVTTYLRHFVDFGEDSGEETAYMIASIISVCLFFTKFALDPVIFAWRLKTYRESFKIVLRQLCSCGDRAALPAVSYHADDNDNEALVEDPVETVVAWVGQIWDDRS